MTPTEPQEDVSWSAITATWLVAIAAAAVSFLFLELHDRADQVVLTLRSNSNSAPGFHDEFPWRMTDAEASAMDVAFDSDVPKVAPEQPQVAKETKPSGGNEGAAALCRAHAPNPSSG